MVYRIYLILVLITCSAHSEVLSESYLKKRVDEKAPEILGQQIRAQEADNALTRFSDQFRPELYADFSYRRTKEEAFIEFQPIISPRTRAELGLRKNLNRGMSLEGSLVSDNLNFDLPDGRRSPAIGYAQLSLALDLWKNFLGKKDHYSQAALNEMYSKNQILAQIGKSNFWIQLRSLFWQIVMLEEQKQIAKRVLKLSERQEADAQNRFRNGISDQAELALYRSQSASRADEILNIKFRQEQLLRSLRSMLPEIEDQKFTIKAPDSNKVRAEVLSCIAQVQQQETPPKEYSFYDEVIEAAEKHYEAKISETKLYDDIDLRFTGSLFTQAVDSQFYGAFEEGFSQSRQGFEVRLQLEVPFSLKNTQKSILQVQRKQLMKEKLELNEKMNSNHYFILNSIELLLESTRNQKVKISNLRTRVKAVEKKYRQGRISLNDFISDQDRLLKAEFSLYESQNLVIQTLLEYFAFFSEFPCQFNVQV